MRKKIIAGNWKMNKTPSQAAELINELKDSINKEDVDVVFCVPFVDLACAFDMLKDSGISVGAQNVYFEDNGAFTGEISAKMLSEIGVRYVIIGHSERRSLFGETDEMINKKLLKVIANDIIPILCVGESLEQREDGVTLDFIRIQVKKAFKNISDEDAKKVVVAYEPIWAIGTGKTATSEQAQEVCKGIRQVISEIYDENVANDIRIQYGGSVKEANAKEIFEMPDIDGALVGGASLSSEFIGIVNYK